MPNLCRPKRPTTEPGSRSRHGDELRRPFSELPDPFEPLYTLFVSGYVLEAIREEGLALRPSRRSSEIERETAP